NKRPLIGDVLDMNLKYTTETDSVLFDSKDAGSDFRMRLEPPAHHGSIEEAFLMMAEGDSAIFKIDGADFYRYTRKLVYVPDFIKPGDKVVFYVRLKKITPKDEFGRQISASDRQYAAEELSMINRFLLTEDLQITPTASGLYFKSLKKQGNIRVKPGNTVSVRYTAMFLDGGVFDAVESNEPPFTFTMGKNEVIAGLEEAVGYMCVGETALAIIPFRLAYGSEKKGIIPPYSTLLFEITVTNAQ
ncbi:MAG TPA: FKBP-type peptidyl-prolyl cis-trans isomerase, partial [Bacteroidales bacterium]|nr:FKBP-type peptidyl-prolyl cis-trans isomerase [Bacteroidales bacterium]